MSGFAVLDLNRAGVADHVEALEAFRRLATSVQECREECVRHETRIRELSHQVSLLENGLEVCLKTIDGLNELNARLMRRVQSLEREVDSLKDNEDSSTSSDTHQTAEPDVVPWAHGDSTVAPEGKTCITCRRLGSYFYNPSTPCHASPQPRCGGISGSEPATDLSRMSPLDTTTRRPWNPPMPMVPDLPLPTHAFLIENVAGVSDPTHGVTPPAPTPQPPCAPPLGISLSDCVEADSPTYGASTSNMTLTVTPDSAIFMPCVVHQEHLAARRHFDNERRRLRRRFLHSPRRLACISSDTDE